MLPLVLQDAFLDALRAALMAGPHNEDSEWIPVLLELGVPYPTTPENRAALLALIDSIDDRITGTPSRVVTRHFPEPDKLEVVLAPDLTPEQRDLALRLIGETFVSVGGRYGLKIEGMQELPEGVREGCQ